MDVVNCTLIMLVLVVLTFILYNWTSQNYWTLQGIPCLPGKLPIVGNGLVPVLSFNVNTSIYTKKIYDDYKTKSMVGLYSLWNPVLMIISPDLVKTVMQTNFNSFQNNSLEMNLENDPLIGRDPIFMKGSSWKKSRGAFSAALTAKRIKDMCPVIQKVAKQMTDHLAKKLKGKDYLDLDVKFLYGQYTSEIAAGTIFSMNGNSFASNYQGTFFHNMKIMLDITRSNTLKHLIVFFVPALSKIIRTRFVPLQVDRYFRRIMKNLEDSRVKSGAAPDDVLQLMLDMEKDQKIEKIDAIAYTFSFFFLSYETSNITLSFVTYFIAKHKDVQHRLREEIMTVMNKHENQLTLEAINDMTYLDQVMKETLRFFPPSGLLSKVCTQPYRLDGHDGLSVEVKVGTTLLIPVLGLHMDSRFWENPEEFNPDRFEKTRCEKMHKFAYLPFGQGGRICPGQRLALNQMKTGIVTIVRNHEIEVAPKMIDPIRIDPKYFMITALGGFWMRLRPLQSN